MGSIHLIRHGQASFGAENYDQLSTLGYSQAVALGNAWEAGAWEPTYSLAGSLQRHAQTAISALDIVEGDGYDVDGGWDEYDHIGIASAANPDSSALDAREFQAVLNQALTAWRRGEGDFDESFDDFRNRVLGAFDAALAQAGKGRRVAVFTSGGPIALVLSHVLTGSDELFQSINDVIINASVTTIINGSTGPRLLSFNEHTHLPPDLVTFR